MPEFKIINNISEITLDKNWVPATKFNSKDRVVDHNGRKIGTDYCERKYRIIEKRECPYTIPERIGRGLFAIVTIILSLGTTLFAKQISLNLLTKKKKTIRYAVLDDQTPFKQENKKIVYLKPELLLSGTKISENQSLNLALIKSSGKQKVVPVTKNAHSESYEIYNGSALDALFILSKVKNPNFLDFKSPIGVMLKYPESSLSEEELIKFLLEKDETGTARICSLNEKSVLDSLDLIKKNNASLDSNIAITLFDTFSGNGNAKLTKMLLELDPSVIDQIQKQGDSAFFKAVLRSRKEEAVILLEAIQSRNLVLSPQDVWIKRAYTNDTGFSDEEFNNLDEKLKLRIFYAANAYANIELVKKLKALGMEEAPFFTTGPHVFAFNMDIITARSSLENFIKDLRQKGQLLTSEEFNKFNRDDYINKTDQIGRIQGTHFIKKIAEENGIKHIKVPKKIAVIHEGLNSIKFNISNDLEIIPARGDFDQITIYAERIKRVDRKLSLLEGIEFMIMLEKTGYSDFFGDNFFIAEDGVYFIDTEFKDFDPDKPKFGSIETIKELLEPKDVEAFMKEFEKRKKAFESEQDNRDKENNKFDDYFENRFKLLTTGYKDHEFTFSTSALL